MRLIAVAILLIFGFLGADARDLLPGDPAPPLQIKQWIKGKPVKSLDQGIYVLDFWATWCVPCVEAMPHMSELARSNPDMTFMAIGVWEKDKNGNVRKFVDKMGSKMDLTVAYSGDRDGMAETWIHAAAQYGIPTTFVVKDGIVQWIGHPLKVDEVLPRIKSGDFDLKSYRGDYMQRATEQRRLWAGQEVLQKAREAFDKGDRTKAHQLLAKAAELDVDIAESKPTIELIWLATEDPKAFDQQIREGILSKDIKVESRIWNLVEGQSHGEVGWPVARRGIKVILAARGPEDYKANERAGFVYWFTEDYKLSLKYTLRALELSQKEPPEIAGARKTYLEKRVADIREKLNGKG